MDVPARIPFAEALGLELLSMADGTASMRLAVRPEQLNSWQVAHGGVVMTLLDVAMAHAARSANAAQPGLGNGVATIEMKTSFLRAATGVLRADARLLHRTATMAFCEASVHDGQGLRCAHATATFKYLRALPASRRQVHPLQRHGESAD